MAERDITMYGDASPDLTYCAEALISAFPDARIVQVIRDGRDVVAGMLADPALLTWFRPGFANVDSEFPNPFFGVETEGDRAAWPGLSLPAKCALRWRGAVRLAARLRRTLSQEQLITVRYETLLEHPAATASAISAFTGAPVSPEHMIWHVPGRPMDAGGWRRALTAEQAAEVEAVAGDDLRRIGYALSSAP